MENKERFLIEEASLLIGIEQSFLLEWIENEWIIPAQIETIELDAEDLARAKLIYNLKIDFEINDQGISVVLHLLDQLYSIRNHIMEK